MNRTLADEEMDTRRLWREAKESELIVMDEYLEHLSEVAASALQAEAEIEMIDDVLSRMRAGMITPSAALDELWEARKTCQITNEGRYRRALGRVYDSMPIRHDGPEPAESSNRAAAGTQHSDVR